MNKKIQNALYLSIIFAFIGYIFSTELWIRYIDSLSSLTGLIIYYIIIYITIFILSKIGLVIGHSKIYNYYHTLGIIFIIFSFFIIFDWESKYINFVSKGEYDENKISNIYLQSEDGAVFDFFYRVTNNIKLSRILTFIITPFILTFIGSLLIEEKVKLGF